MQSNLHQKRYENKSNGNKFNAYKPKSNNFKKKGNCFVCGKPGHHAPQCRKRVRNDNPPLPNANLVEGDEQVIYVVVS